MSMSSRSRPIADGQNLPPIHVPIAEEAQIRLPDDPLRDEQHEDQDKHVLELLEFVPWQIGSDATRSAVFTAVLKLAVPYFGSYYKMLSKEEKDRLLTDANIQKTIDQACTQRKFKNVRNLGM
jgi:hypothetical protein